MKSRLSIRNIHGAQNILGPLPEHFIEGSRKTLCSDFVLESDESEGDAPILVHVAIVDACEAWFLCIVSVVLVFTVVSVSSIRRGFLLQRVSVSGILG